jgi:hypothetical protein
MRMEELIALGLDDYDGDADGRDGELGDELDVAAEVGAAPHPELELARTSPAAPLVEVLRAPDWGVPPDLYARQRWGGEHKNEITGTPAAAGAPPFTTLVRVELPERYARDWILTLGAPMLADGGDPQVNQLYEPRILTALPTTFPDTRSATVRVACGHGGAQAEIVDVDYPARGGMLRLRGNYVEVTMSDQFVLPAGVRARYTANLAPAEGRSNPSDSWQPCRTMRLGDVGIGAAVIGTLPRRARTMTFSTTGLPTTVAIEFFSNATALALYLYQAAAGRNTPSFPEPFLPIPHGANAWRFTNQGAAILTACALRFNLDL